MRSRTLAVLALVLVAGGLAEAKPKKAPPKPPPEEPAPPVEEPKPKAPEPPPPPGPGDKRRVVGILDVRVDGVPAEIAAQFQSSLDQQLDSREYWLAPRTRLHDMMSNSTKWSEGCLVGMCLNEVRIQTGAELVLLAAINGSGTSFGYVVTLVRTDTGRVLAQESERCDVCTVNEALTNATLAAIKLLTTVPDKLPDEAADQRAAMDVVTKQHEHDKAALQRHRSHVATALALTGLAIAAGGTALYFTQDHANYGLATAAVGSGLAIGGLVALSF